MKVTEEEIKKANQWAKDKEAKSFGEVLVTYAKQIQQEKNKAIEDFLQKWQAPEGYQLEVCGVKADNAVGFLTTNNNLVVTCLWNAANGQEYNNADYDLVPKKPKWPTTIKKIDRKYIQKNKEKLTGYTDAFSQLDSPLRSFEVLSAAFDMIKEIEGCGLPTCLMEILSGHFALSINEKKYRDHLEKHFPDQVEKCNGVFW